MMFDISLGLVWLFLAVVVLGLILLRRWMKKKADLTISEQHPQEFQDTAPAEGVEPHSNPR